MDIKTYNKIKSFCIKNLFNQSLRDRHLDDCVQFVAMGYFESGEEKPWKWLLADYCRQNGIGKRGRLGAKTIESSLSIDAPGTHEDSNDSYYLLDQESISRSGQDDRIIHHDDEKRGVIEVFLAPLNLNNEVLEWATKSYKVKMN